MKMKRGHTETTTMKKIRPGSTTPNTAASTRREMSGVAIRETGEMVFRAWSTNMRNSLLQSYHNGRPGRSCCSIGLPFRVDRYLI